MNAMLKIGDFIEAGPVDTIMEMPVPQRWYLLGVAPNRERKVMRGFELRKIAAYCPLVKKSIWSPRGARVLTDRAMFPGIVFVPDFDADLTRLKHVDGVTRFIHFGENAACLGPDTMRDIHLLEATSAVAPGKREARFKTGQLVRIESGPFRDWQGRFEKLDDRGRYQVGLEIFGKLTLLPVDGDDVSEA